MKVLGFIVILWLGCLAIALSGCSGLSTLNMGQDSFVLAGTPEGIQAYNDGIVAHITEARVDPKIKSGYWQNRDQETAVRGLKFKVKK